MKPKSNLQIATHSNHFPTYHESDNIIRSHLLLHRSSKLALIALKTRKVRIMLHISQTINMYTKAYCAHGDHHRSTQSIKTQKPRYFKCMRRKPCSLRKTNCCSSTPDFVKQYITDDSAHKHRKNSHQSPTTSSDPSTR